jgi:iron complex outermembrane receptor protein
VSERFSQGVHHGTAQYEIGDSSLGKERTSSLDATLRHLGARTRFELSAYHNRIDGFIFLMPREPISTVRGAYPAYQYTATDALLQGIEASYQIDPTGWLSLYGSGTLVRGTVRATGEPLYDMPADRLIASARIYGPRGRKIVDPYLEFGTTLVRRQDRTPPATIYRLPTDGYALFNLELGASEIHLAGQRFEVGLSIRNLFNTAYRDYLSRYRLYVDDPGRDVVLRFRTGFGRTGN